MNKQDMLILYRYNQWANAKIMNAAAGLTQEQYLAPGAFPHGGLRGTLVHALFAEWLWRRRWEGTSPTSAQRFKPEEFATLGALQARWAEEEKHLMDFVDGLTDERLNSPLAYTNLSGKPLTKVLWQAMLHVVNHGTQHRSEAAALLTDFGCSPGDLDLIYFLDEI